MKDTKNIFGWKTLTINSAREDPQIVPSIRKVPFSSVLWANPKKTTYEETEAQRLFIISNLRDRYIVINMGIKAQNVSLFFILHLVLLYHILKRVDTYFKNYYLHINK